MKAARYGIADRDSSTRWGTIDGTNTYTLRNQRRKLLANILDKKVFHQGKYEQDKEFAMLNQEEQTIKNKFCKGVRKYVRKIVA